MKKIVLISVILSVLCGVVKTQAQQIPLFSQYMFNGTYINPALVGAKDAFYANIMYRNQWIGFNGSPQTAMFSIDGSLSKGSNVGLKYINDQVGANNTSNIALDYAYRFNVSEKGRLSFGLSAGFVNYEINRAKLNPSEDEPAFAENDSKWKPTVDAGVYFFTDKFYAGVSALGIIRHKADANSLFIMRSYVNLLLNVGGTIPISNKVDFQPSALLKSDFKNPMNVDLNAMLQIDKKFWVGGGYRTGLVSLSNLDKNTHQYDAISFIFEILILNQVRLGASYDFDLSKIASNNGSIEISLGYYLAKPKRK